MLSTRVNARLTGPLAAYVKGMVGKEGLYETPSEYIRDLIRRDMEGRAGRMEQDAILEGYRDMAEGRMIVSSGDFHGDMKTLAEKESDGW